MDNSIKDSRLRIDFKKNITKWLGYEGCAEPDMPLPDDLGNFIASLFDFPSYHKLAFHQTPEINETLRLLNGPNGYVIFRTIVAKKELKIPVKM